MELKKLVRQEGDTYEATWVLDNDQMAALYWFAINELVGRGMATVVDITPEELERLRAEAEKKGQEDFLKEIPTDGLPQA